VVNILLGVVIVLATISIPLVLFWKAEAIIKILKSAWWF